MVINDKDSPRFEVYNSDTKIKQSQKVMCNIVTEDKKCDTENQKDIEIVKGVFQKLSKGLRDRKILLETKKKMSAELLCNI